MAKKKPARADFNMSAEIRDMLEADSSLSGRQVLEALQAKFPDQEINANSCNVAFSNARRKLGIRRSGKKAVVRRPRPAAVAARSTGRAAAAAPASVSLDALKAACELVAKAGGTEAAIGIVRSLAALKLG